MNSIVLMYHCVYKESPIESGFQNGSAFQYKVNIKDFEKQVQTLAQLDSSVVFSFDDGGISFYNIIAPILEKYNQKGLFFISTKYIGTDGFMTQEHILDLYKRGHIIGTHSHSHPSNLAVLSYNDILVEWKQSKEILSNICHANINIASIPNGYLSRTILEAAKEAGIEVLYTSIPISYIKKKYGITLIGRYVIHKYLSLNYVNSIILSKWLRLWLWVKYELLSTVKFVIGPYYDRLKALIVRG